MTNITHQSPLLDGRIPALFHDRTELLCRLVPPQTPTEPQDRIWPQMGCPAFCLLLTHWLPDSSLALWKVMTVVCWNRNWTPQPATCYRRRNKQLGSHAKDPMGSQLRLCLWLTSRMHSWLVFLCWGPPTGKMALLISSYFRKPSWDQSCLQVRDAQRPFRKKLMKYPHCQKHNTAGPGTVPCFWAEGCLCSCLHGCW